MRRVLGHAPVFLAPTGGGLFSTVTLDLEPLRMRCMGSFFEFASAAAVSAASAALALASAAALASALSNTPRRWAAAGGPRCFIISALVSALVFLLSAGSGSGAGSVSDANSASARERHRQWQS